LFLSDQYRKALYEKNRAAYKSRPY